MNIDVHVSILSAQYYHAANPAIASSSLHFFPGDIPLYPGWAGARFIRR